MSGIENMLPFPHRSSAGVLLALAVALVGLAGCGDPNTTRAAPDSEEQSTPQAESTHDAPDTLAGPGTTAPLAADDNPDLTAELTSESSSDGALGVWAKEPGTCGNTEGRDIPLQIDPGTFTGPYGRCELVENRETGRGTWEAEMQCPEPPEAQRVTLQVEGNVLYAIYHALGDQGVSYIRCTPD